MPTDPLLLILAIILLGAAIAGIIQSAPFIGAPFKAYALWAIGAILLVAVIIQLFRLFGWAAG